MLIIDLAAIEGQIICPPDSSLNLAEASAVSAANWSQTAVLVLGEPIRGEFMARGQKDENYFGLQQAHEGDLGKGRLVG